MLITSRGALISIIVPVGSAQRLKNVTELLESIGEQTYKEIETFLVCDEEKLKQRLLNHIRAVGLDKVSVVLNDNSPGASSARNMGAKRANGEILAFLDDDVLLHQTWARELIKTFEDENVAGVTGCTIPLQNGQPVDWLPTEFLWIVGGTYWRAKGLVNVMSASGMNFAIRKWDFKVVGMYNVELGPHSDYPEAMNWKRLGGEDSDLVLRIIRRSKRVIYNPKAKAYHTVRPSSSTMKAIIKRALHVGHNRSVIWRLYRGSIDSTGTERELLLRVLNAFLPETLSLVMKKPMLAIRRLIISIVVMAAVFVGFFIGLAS